MKLATPSPYTRMNRYVKKKMMKRATSVAYKRQRNISEPHNLTSAIHFISGALAPVIMVCVVCCTSFAGSTRNVVVCKVQSENEIRRIFVLAFRHSHFFWVALHMSDLQFRGVESTWWCANIYFSRTKHKKKKKLWTQSIIIWLPTTTMTVENHFPWYNDDDDGWTWLEWLEQRNKCWFVIRMGK